MNELAIAPEILAAVRRKASLERAVEACLRVDVRLRAVVGRLRIEGHDLVGLRPANEHVGSRDPSGDDDAVLLLHLDDERQQARLALRSLLVGGASLRGLP